MKNDQKPEHSTQKYSESTEQMEWDTDTVMRIKSCIVKVSGILGGSTVQDTGQAVVAGQQLGNILDLLPQALNQAHAAGKAEGGKQGYLRGIQDQAKKDTEKIIEYSKLRLSDYEAGKAEGRREEANKEQNELDSQQVVRLRADIAHAIGYCRGLGHPVTYLEYQYPDLVAEKDLPHDRKR